jgi:hypothetical protein
MCMFCRLFLLFCLFSVGCCIVSPSSIYGSWLPLWYLHNSHGTLYLELWWHELKTLVLFIVVYSLIYILNNSNFSNVYLYSRSLNRSQISEWLLFNEHFFRNVMASLHYDEMMSSILYLPSTLGWILYCYQCRFHTRNRTKTKIYTSVLFYIYIKYIQSKPTLICSIFIKVQL